MEFPAYYAHTRKRTIWLGVAEFLAVLAVNFPPLVELEDLVPPQDQHLVVFWPEEQAKFIPTYILCTNYKFWFQYFWESCFSLSRIKYNTNIHLVLKNIYFIIHIQYKYLPKLSLKHCILVQFGNSCRKFLKLAGYELTSSKYMASNPSDKASSELLTTWNQIPRFKFRLCYYQLLCRTFTVNENV